MTTDTTTRYNKTDRIPVHCKETGKLLARISLVGLWPDDLTQWLWCRGCHEEHKITRQYIEEARVHPRGYNKTEWNPYC